jgi:hypothetical protein
MKKNPKNSEIEETVDIETYKISTRNMQMYD